MYSNLLKRGATVLKEENTRVIDSNALIEKKLGNVEGGRLTPMPADRDGFSRGLSADVLKEQEDTAGQDATDMLHAASMEQEDTAEQQEEGPDVEELRRQALLEIERMQEEARALLDTECRKALEAAREQGYQEGLARATKEADDMKRKLLEEEKSLQKQYEELLDNLEPQFIDALSGIYEHIFHVELSGYRDLIVYLIANTLRKIDGGRDMIIHVSKEDYPYVNMQKKQVMESAVTGNAAFEIIEDITLSKNQAMIETDGGIFDCSLGTQLSELSRKLKLLSYEGTGPEGET